MTFAKDTEHACCIIYREYAKTPLNIEAEAPESCTKSSISII